jgi:hypothetical protein
VNATVHPVGEQPLESLEYLEKRASSSSVVVDSSRSDDDDDGAAITNPGKAKPENWWTAADVTRASELLRESVGHFNQLGEIGVGLLEAILPNMLHMADFEIWLGSTKGFFEKAKTWGRHVVDSRKWPQRREATLAQSKPEPRPRPDPQPRRAEPRRNPAKPYCPKCKGTGSLIIERGGYSGTTDCECRNLPKCSLCADEGIIDEHPNPARWCTCSAGAHRQELHPGGVDSVNEMRAKLAKMAAKAS